MNTPKTFLLFGIFVPLNLGPPPGAAEVAVSVTCERGCERDTALAVRPDAERDARAVGLS